MKDAVAKIEIQNAVRQEDRICINQLASLKDELMMQINRGVFRGQCNGERVAHAVGYRLLGAQGDCTD